MDFNKELMNLAEQADDKDVQKLIYLILIQSERQTDALQRIQNDLSEIKKISSQSDTLFVESRAREELYKFWLRHGKTIFYGLGLLVAVPWLIFPSFAEIVEIMRQR